MVSIIIPVYNSEKYLNKCFDSILQQSYKNYEVIIVDDGSTDNSMNICTQYTLRDKRFKIYQKSNGGASSARNYGLTKVTGRWICFIDSDDYVKKDYLKKLREHAVDKSCVMLLKDQSGIIINKKNIPDYIINNFIQLNTINKLYDYKVIEKYNIRFPLGIENGEDFVFACTYFKYINSLIVINAYEYIYNRNENSISNKKNNYEAEKRDYLAMRISWEQLLKEIKTPSNSIMEKTWKSPVRTRFEHLLYSILRSRCNRENKIKLMNQIKVDIRNYAIFYNGKVKTKLIAMFILKNEYFNLYLLFNSFLFKFRKHFA